MASITKTQANEILKKEKVRWIQVQFVDVFGRIKCIFLPSRKFTDGKTWENGVNFDGSSVGFLSSDDSDLNALPDPSTLRIMAAEEGKEKTALVICSIRDAKTRKPFPGDPRSIATQTENMVKDAGFDRTEILSEMEFFVFPSMEAAQIENDIWGIDSNIGGGSLKVIPTLLKPLIDHEYIIKPKQGYFLAPPMDRVAGYRIDVSNAMEDMGFPIKYNHHENGNGQHEIEFEFLQRISHAADAVVMFKQMARTISDRYGFVPTFMPKPIFGDLGSGQHAHICLKKGENNAFFDKDEVELLSQTGRYFIGGILNRAREITAITNPIINSYKRLVPEFEAPVFVSWSFRNRTALLRVAAPTGEEHIDVEPRQADPTCNPYLAYSLYVQAGLEGIKKKMSPGDPVIGDVTKLSKREMKQKGIGHLPTTLEDALEEMENSTFVKRVLGKNLFEYYLEKKHQEVFYKRIYVSPWEHYMYFNV